MSDENIFDIYPEADLYKCLVRGFMEEDGQEYEFYQIYFAEAASPGAAIERIEAVADENGVIPATVTDLGWGDLDNLDDDAGETLREHPDGDVWWLEARCLFPPEPRMDLPYGIVASLDEVGEDDPGDIRPGYALVDEGEGLRGIDVNVDRADLPSLYEKLLRLHPGYKVFWYRLHAEHPDEEEDPPLMLVNPDLNTPELILAHLAENSRDSFENGLVTLTAYLAEGDTNLNLSDHKRLVIRTFSENVLQGYLEALREAGYAEVENLVAIDWQIHHWHYRHPEGREHEALAEFLKTKGFREWRPGEPHD
jgi:hypothetical protein